MFISCQSSEQEYLTQNETLQEIKGVHEFKLALNNLSNDVDSRSLDEDPTDRDIETLIEISRDFLNRNEITCDELEINDDEIIAVIALAILDYQKTELNFTSSRTTAGGCVLEALGVKEVINATGKGVAKKIAKATAKAVLKRAVPYIGWGLFIYDYIACVVE